MSPKQNHYRIDGFTMIESIVGIAVFMIIAVGLYRSYFTLTQGVSLSRARVVALTVVNDQLELVRNLSFQDVGIVSGIPAGKLAKQVAVTKGGFAFTVTRTIRNIDDPFDGTIGGSPPTGTSCQLSAIFTGEKDTAPADYRCVEVEVVCANCGNFSPVKGTTTVAPKSLEFSGDDGALFITVFDASGGRVAGASVHATNTQITPNIDIDELTDNNGQLQLVGVPISTNGYHIAVTKPGYSSDMTYPPGNPSNPNPTNPDATVRAAEVTQVSFGIDQVSALHITTTNQTCAPLPDVDFRLDGTKLIGTSPNVLKYSKNFAADGSGTKTVADLEWDDYVFLPTGASYDLLGVIPVMPLKLNPDTTQNVQLIMATKNPEALLINVKDAAFLPITGALVEIEKGANKKNETTGEGAWRQTDWSLGDGEPLFTNATKKKYFSDNGNVENSKPPGIVELRKIGGNYQSPGELISSTFDTGLVSDFHTISWEPADQDHEDDLGDDPVRFQVASSNDPSGPWNDGNFVGPDGTSGSYYTATDNNISNHNGNRYIRYKLILSTKDHKRTPKISDIILTYTSSCIPPGQVFFNGLDNGKWDVTITKVGYQTWKDKVDLGAGFQTLNATLNPM